MCASMALLIKYVAATMSVPIVTSCTNCNKSDKISFVSEHLDIKQSQCFNTFSRNTDYNLQ